MSHRVILSFLSVCSIITSRGFKKSKKIKDRKGYFHHEKNTKQEVLRIKNSFAVFHFNRTPCRYSNYRNSGGNAVAGIERRQRKSAFHFLYQSDETDRAGAGSVLQ